MKINMAMWDRILRFMIGVFLTAWAVAGGPWWAFIGIYLVITSAWGLCPVYAFFKIKTAKITEKRFIP